MSKKLYLMRHGETLFNQLKKVQGACDSPLTTLGQEQAKQARNYFRQKQIQFAGRYASTQERACDTMEMIQPNSFYTRKKGLKEWNFGFYEGAPEYLNPPHKSGQESYGDFFLDYGGESVDQVEQRMTTTLTQIMEDLEGENALAVSSGGALFSFYLKWRQEKDRRPTFSNCCILVYTYQEGQFYLQTSIDPGK
ncbi:histidine phosphatase family protein [Tetragenococcus osmophilus]|uniref:Histidine phosphatase family protein n=1 Tax=Tetragenococcus osmophilus TaxID=526944 RepID=A0AA38CXE7_9ENTE|nr:histidine phosphatase family protein [Tetragenococcus osmophilus]AYW48859.1 histidine phosphatase family protein [Tetragenococcus osmophilus]GMA54881.1 phosphoglycerate mutase [Alicyclobacillus contaminans]GMA71320.1 phosphoglycerate mutase [Tetragenococcus osmophilus]